MCYPVLQSLHCLNICQRCKKKKKKKNSDHYMQIRNMGPFFRSLNQKKCKAFENIMAQQSGRFVLEFFFSTNHNRQVWFEHNVVWAYHFTLKSVVTGCPWIFAHFWFFCPGFLPCKSSWPVIQSVLIIQENFAKVWYSRSSHFKVYLQKMIYSEKWGNYMYCFIYKSNRYVLWTH